MTLKNYVKSLIGPKSASALKRYSIHSRYIVNRFVVSQLHQAVLNPLNRVRYAKRPNRYLEIGPGTEVIDGFETINVVSGKNVTYIGNAIKRLPFGDNTFEVVYASHVIEHLPWYKVESAVEEWVRVLKPGGALEIWTPHGLRIAKAFVDAEERGTQDFHNDGWWRFNEEHDPCKWASGRFFSYGDGSGRDHPNWHRSVFSPRYLKLVLERAGLIDIEEMNRSKVRGYDHGWINLGIAGRKSKSS